MKKLFKLEENGTTLSAEIRAGLTTFVAMAYIIFLNPVFLSATGMNASGVLAATCLPLWARRCLHSSATSPLLWPPAWV